MDENGRNVISATMGHQVKECHFLQQNLPQTVQLSLCLEIIGRGVGFFPMNSWH